MPAASLIACHECDLLQREPHLPDGGVARCGRCGATLFRSHPESLDRALAFTLGALFLFVIANLYPIVGLSINGDLIQATLFGTVQILYRDDMALVAGLVFFTAFLTPLLQMLATLHLLLPLRLARLPQNPNIAFHVLTTVRPWVMIEVFVLGILVSLVKLAHMAAVIPGIALWSFVGVMLLLAAAGTSFDPRELWAKLGTTS
jgi:paraquat-inducible protein A